MIFGLQSQGDGKVGLHNAWRMMDLGNKEKVSNFETLCNLRSKYNSIKKDMEYRYDLVLIYKFIFLANLNNKLIYCIISSILNFSIVLEPLKKQTAKIGSRKVLFPEQAHDLTLCNL